MSEDNIVVVPAEDGQVVNPENGNVEVTNQPSVGFASTEGQGGEISGTPVSEPAVTPEVSGTLPVVDSSAPVEVYFEGAKVLEVLGDGPTPGQKNCKMSDGTTKHVPVELLN